MFVGPYQKAPYTEITGNLQKNVCFLLRAAVKKVEISCHHPETIPCTIYTLCRSNTIYFPSIVRMSETTLLNIYIYVCVSIFW